MSTVLTAGTDDVSIGNGAMTRTKRESKGKSLVGFPPDYTVLDLETTGLEPQTNCIIEVAALRIRNNEIVDSFSTLVKPNCKVSKTITKLTGITNNMVSAAPPPEDVLPSVREFIGDDVIVGHNVNFDINFLYDWFEIILNEPFTNDFVDTLRLSRKVLPGLEHHRLTDIASALEVHPSGFHRALEDCHTTYKCFLALHERVCVSGDIDKFTDNFKNSQKNQHKIAVGKPDFDSAHLPRTSFSSRYKYSNVSIDGYGDYSILEPNKFYYKVELTCDGEIGDESLPVNIIVDGVKVGHLPNNRLQAMWHAYNRRGERVLASVDTFDQCATLVLDYQERSADAYVRLIAKGVEHVTLELSDCDTESIELNRYRDKDELDLDFDFSIDRYVITDYTCNVAVFPKAANSFIDSEDSCRVFIKSLTKDSDNKYSLLVDVFFEKPVETVVMKPRVANAAYDSTEAAGHDDNSYDSGDAEESTGLTMMIVVVITVIILFTYIFSLGK
ncbi:MAG: 3'-5' exonuclease [Christensenellaceae bacterium]|nr:3'-5' exonuclease [Christensenellaceae bacterium]